MTMPRPTRRTPQSGFTLLEMLISMALLLVLTGTILGGMATMQRNYRGSEIRIALTEQIRASLEMMAQEIGQAGLPSSGMAGNSIYTGVGVTSGSVGQITQAIVANTTAQSVPMTNPLIQQNQIVIVYNVLDGGASTEQVTVASISGSPVDHITAVFKKAHSTNSFIYPHGVYPNGIAFQTPTPTTSGYMSNQMLIMFGDINGTGTLSVVQYSCPTAATATYTDSNGVQWGALRRDEYDYNDASASFPSLTSTSILLDRVRVASTLTPTPITTPLPAADGCRFDYNIFVPTIDSNYYMATSVNVTVVAESRRNDPQTNSPVIIAKSFMNIQPRNIVNAYNLYNYNSGTTPPLADLGAEFLMPSQVVITKIASLLP